MEICINGDLTILYDVSKGSWPAAMMLIGTPVREIGGEDGFCGEFHAAVEELFQEYELWDVRGDS